MFLFFILFSLLITFSSAQFSTDLNKLFPNNFGACTSPKQKEGRCIFLRECEALNKTIIKLYLTSIEIHFLQDSYCGHYEDEVVVCCIPDSITTARTSISKTTNMDIRVFPEPGVCGGGAHTKIIGGVNANIDEFPWTVLLQHVESDKKIFLCGGSLIHEQYVLTAAHCFHARNFNITNVRLGEYDLSTDIDCEEDDCADEPVDVGIEKVYEHEEYFYGSRNKYHDIALVKLAQPIKFTDWIKPICLPLANSLRTASFSNVSLDVTGWGHTETAPISVIKLKAWVRGVRLDECSVVYAAKRVILQDSQICAIGDNGQDTCEGDSGGPLIGFQRVNTPRPYYFIAGIVSFGPTPCGKKGIPGVYTKVSYYIDWITSKILNG